MSVDKSDIENIAKLARIRIDESAVSEMTERLDNILAMVDQLQTVNTDDVEPMANPMDASQRLRADEVSESNQREAFQAIAPNADAGLYLVPKVIE